MYDMYDMYESCVPDLNAWRLFSQFVWPFSKERGCVKSTFEMSMLNNCNIQPITNEPNTDGLEKVTIDTLTGICLAIWVEHFFRIKLGILIGVRYSKSNWCCCFLWSNRLQTHPHPTSPSLLKNREISWGCECLHWPSFSCNALGCTQHGC